MQDQRSMEPIATAQLPSTTLRDWVAPCCRHWLLMAVSCLVVLAGVVVVTWSMPTKYRAQMKVLVKRDRTDPVVNPDPNTQLAMASLTEEDLNSEAELIQSPDLLEKVVVDTGLDKRNEPSYLGSLRSALEAPFGNAAPSGRVRTVNAVRRLQKSLSVEPVRKTKLIVVTYESTDPELAAQVLNRVSHLYLEKHIAVHQVPGARGFFEQQTEQYRGKFLKAQEKLSDFVLENGVVAASVEKGIAIQKLADFEGDLEKARVARSETERRILSLQALAGSTTARLTTQVKTLDNAGLIERLKSTVLDLELKHADLLTKYAPDYRTVKDVEGQLAQARATLSREENNPLHEETTDRNTTYQWIQEELAKARAQLSSLHGQEESIAGVVTLYHRRAQELHQAELDQEGLLRSAKIAEDNYLLYSRKQEEAGIQDALDQRRIINVAVAEEPRVPALPSSPSRALTLALGAVLACFVSVGLGYTADYMDSTIRTPNEIEVLLHTRVLASLPKKG